MYDTSACGAIGHVHGPTCPSGRQTDAPKTFLGVRVSTKPGTLRLMPMLSGRWFALIRLRGG